ncbi:hypothetical protein MVEN_01891100 [Mycena venus]|uniref:Uncharacterized protein n=1 Tax=Mycena venus TaxID=2733690 RepID=A0A8H6XIZ3_9AGAR|nr:hypothetical protein MVEN_01891100 [Mycena venus]
MIIAIGSSHSIRHAFQAAGDPLHRVRPCWHCIHPSSPLLLTLAVISTSQAALTNITIDDSNLTCFTWIEDTGSPQPNLPWAAITPTSPCLYCSAQPLTADIYNKTWHDGSNNSAASFTFQGSAIYIYGIDLKDPANISFTMDGNVLTFHYYNGSEQFVFNSLFFLAKDLIVGVNHTVSWVLHATRANGTIQTALFDYAIVTVDQSQTSTSANRSPSSTGSPTIATKSKSHTSAIAGGVVGGLATMGTIVVVTMLLEERVVELESSRRRYGSICRPRIFPRRRQSEE